MKPLKITLKISILMLWLAAILFVIGGTLAIVLFPKLFTAIFLTSIFTAILSIPFTIVSLGLAYKQKIVTGGYVLFSTLFSCFIAGLGWFIIPFLLNKDINSLEPQAESAEP